jgi:hypothetical protein
VFDDDQTICPSCGNKVAAGDETCGFCGSPLMGEDATDYERPRPQFQRLSPTEEPMPAQPRFPSDTYTGTGTVVASGARWVKLAVFLVALAVIAATAIPIFLAMQGVDEAFNTVPDIDVGGENGGRRKPVQLEGAYRNSRSLVADLKRNGVRCTNLDVATRNAFVEAGICYVKGEPLNTQLYFDATALSGVLGNMGNLRQSNVVHEANWIVMTPTSRRLARDVKAAIGGKLE